MRYLGSKGGWHELAIACLKNAVKQGDFESVYNDVFSTICELAGFDENEVIVELIHAKDMKELYGDKWYRRIVK
jgi:hypothetical protein